MRLMAVIVFMLCNSAFAADTFNPIVKGQYNIVDEKGRVVAVTTCAVPHWRDGRGFCVWNETGRGDPVNQDGQEMNARFPCGPADRAYNEACAREVYTSVGVESKVKQEIANHAQEIQSAILKSYKDILNDPQFRAMLAEMVRHIQSGN